MNQPSSHAPNNHARLSPYPRQNGSFHLLARNTSSNGLWTTGLWIGFTPGLWIGFTPGLWIGWTSGLWVGWTPSDLLCAPGLMVSPPHGYVPGCYNDPTPVSIGQRLSNGLIGSSRTLVCTILTSDQISDSHVLSNGCTSLFPCRINTSNTGLVSCFL